MFNRPFVDLAGRKFGRLTVLMRVPNQGEYVSWECRCDCGVTKIVAGKYLKDGRVVSCGCAQLERAYTMNHKHGLAKTPEHGIWLGLRARCLNPRGRSYKWYGARGITVCERWLNDFAAFFSDMGPRPSPKHSIDRIDSNGNYEPDNCRWATSIEQARNKRDGATETHCRRGHQFTEATLYINRLGKRECRTCRDDSSRRYRAKLISHQKDARA